MAGKKNIYTVYTNAIEVKLSQHNPKKAWIYQRYRFLNKKTTEFGSAISLTH